MRVEGPLHSVILANYNGAKYLEQAIGSVLSQRDVRFELILVDDASDDGSLEIMKRFQMAFPELVKVFLHPVNKGQGAGFNTGYEHSNGDYISFIDSDDIWTPLKLLHVERVFSALPEASVHHHQLLVMEDTVPTENRVVDLMALGDLGKRWLALDRHPNILPGFAPTAAISLPRHIMERLMPCPQVRICADMWLTYGALAFGPVSGSLEHHGWYRIHDANNYFGRNVEMWAFFKKEMLPQLRLRWSESGVENVIPDNWWWHAPPKAAASTFWDKLLDLSIRKFLAILKRGVGMS